MATHAPSAARAPEHYRDLSKITTMAAVETDRSGLEILGREECLRLLRTVTLGRVGITIGALPVVVPMNFRLIGDRVVLRVGLGTSLDAAILDAVVAFEADQVNQPGRGGWSVSVTGVAREITEPDEIAQMRHEHISRWMEWGADRYIAISTEMVSGRRIPPDPVLAKRDGT